MIRLESIGKTYIGKTGHSHEALKDVNIKIKQGSVYGIIGRSGAGKSTLIRLLNLLERPTVGQVFMRDQDITHLEGNSLLKLRHKIGMVFQHFNLLSTRTVLDNVCFPLRVAGISKAKRQQKAKELLNLVGLEDHIYKYPAQLSGGQKQRVGIARALANDPELLLCDEATSALDPETTQSILELLLDISQRLGITIVLITHSMDVIRAVCDEVAVLDHGQVVEQGDVIDVFLHPQHETTQSLLIESSGMDAEGWKAFDTEGQIVRLSYRGETTAQPLLSRVSRDLNAEISILQGGIGKLKDVAYGQLVVSIVAEPAQYQNIERFFKDNDVDYEVLQS